MNLKVEMNSPEELLELQEFLYEKEPDLVVNEVYEMQPGFHKEPISVAIIIALGGPVIMKTVQVALKEFFEWKRKKTEELTKREQNRQLTQIELAKLSLQKEHDWTMVQKEDFIRMDYQ